MLFVSSESVLPETVNYTRAFLVTKTGVGISASGLSAHGLDVGAPVTILTALLDARCGSMAFAQKQQLYSL
jgi:hypothetical protein